MTKAAHKNSPEVKLLTPTILNNNANCGNTDTQLCLICIYLTSDEE